LDVIRAALDLLETADTPTIEDYPIEADAEGPEPWACPLNLAVEADDSLAGRVRAEVARLRPWAAETRRNRGRTLFGLSGAGVDQVDEVVDALLTVVETGDVDGSPNGEIEWAHEMPFLIRHLVDDLRGYYHEAVAAQPGQTPPDHDALNDWIFEQTALGELLIAIGDALTGAEETSPFAPLVRGLTIPEGHYHGRGGFEGVAGYRPDD
ncbi:MAG: hypothetical protein AAF081_19550, partial [Actinomycetota bacterium]